MTNVGLGVNVVNVVLLITLVEGFKDDTAVKFVPRYTSYPIIEGLPNAPDHERT